MAIRIPWTCAFLFFSLGLVATTLHYDSWNDPFISSAYYNRKLVNPNILWKIMLPLLGVIPGIPVFFDFINIFTKPTANGKNKGVPGQKKLADGLVFALLIFLTAYVLIHVNPNERRLGEIYARNPSAEAEQEMAVLAPKLYVAHQVLFAATSLAIVLQVWSYSAAASSTKKD